MAKLEGTIKSISDAGYLVSDISAEQLSDTPRGEEVSVSCAGHETNGVYAHDHNEPDSTFVAMIGPSGHLEIGIVGINISEMLRINVGEKIVVKW